MTYYLLQFNGFQAFQEIQDGQVVRYCDMGGTTLFVLPPIGDGGAIVDLNPTRLPWMDVAAP